MGNKALLKKMRKGKYGNVKFGAYDSKKEAAFGRELELLRGAEDPSVRVARIEHQVRFELIPAQRSEAGKLLERKCEYVADFRVTRAHGRVDVIDVKGYKTPEYIIKRKLMLFLHGIRVIEV